MYIYFFLIIYTYLFIYRHRWCGEPDWNDIVVNFANFATRENSSRARRARFFCYAEYSTNHWRDVCNSIKHWRMNYRAHMVWRILSTKCWGIFTIYPNTFLKDLSRNLMNYSGRWTSHGCILAYIEQCFCLRGILLLWHPWNPSCMQCMMWQDSEMDITHFVAFWTFIGDNQPCCNKLAVDIKMTGCCSCHLQLVS